jgi:hypothetical protein
VPPAALASSFIVPPRWLELFAPDELALAAATATTVKRIIVLQTRLIPLSLIHETLLSDPSRSGDRQLEVTGGRSTTTRAPGEPHRSSADPKRDVHTGLDAD